MKYMKSMKVLIEIYKLIRDWQSDSCIQPTYRLSTDTGYTYKETKTSQVVTAAVSLAISRKFSRRLWEFPQHKQNYKHGQCGGSFHLPHRVELHIFQTKPDHSESSRISECVQLCGPSSTWGAERKRCPLRIMQLRNAFAFIRNSFINASQNERLRQRTWFRLSFALTSKWIWVAVDWFDWVALLDMKYVRHASSHVSNL